MAFTFADAIKAKEERDQEAASSKLIPSEAPEIHAPLLMPPEGYFDHIGLNRARRAEERVKTVVEHLTTVPPNVDLNKPGAKSSIRTFGVPAASLQNTLEFPPKGWAKSESSISKIKAGIKGEELTAKALAQWADDKPDVVICHSVSIPRKEGDNVDTEIEVLAHHEEDEQDLDEERKVTRSPDEELGVVDAPDTDHVVVVGSQVWIIDSKMWKAGVDLNDPKSTYNFRYSTPQRKTNFSILGGGSSIPRYVRMKQAIHLWQKYVGGPTRGYVRGIVNIHPKDVNNPEHKLDPSEPKTIPGSIKFLRLDEWYAAPFKPTDNTRFISMLDEWYDRMRDDEKGYIDVGLVTLVARTPVKVRSRVEEFFGDNLKGFI